MDAVKDFGELGARIRQVRLGAGLDQTSLARSCRLERTALSRIESGERKVSALELTRIAEALRVTLGDLILLPLADVRAARPPVDEDSRPEEREIFRAGLDLDRAWRDLCRLRDDGLLEPVDLGMGGGGVDSPEPEQAQALAREVRGFLDVGDAPLGAMTDVAAELGLWCRTTAARVDGLSLTPQPGLGVAVIGADLEPGRRRATAAHEIGHHVVGDTHEASGHYAIPREAEERIDAFAAELLLPQAVVGRLHRPSRDELIELAADYRVSWSLLTATAEQAGVDLKRADAYLNPVDDDFYRVVGARPEEDLRAPGLPRAWIMACARARDERLVTPRRASELTLGVLSGGESRCSDQRTPQKRRC